MTHPELPFDSDPKPGDVLEVDGHRLSAVCADLRRRGLVPLALDVPTRSRRTYRIEVGRADPRPPSTAPVS